MKTKNPVGFLVWAVITTVIGVICIISRFVLAYDRANIKKSSAHIVKVGSRTMSKSEYFDYADNVISKCTIIGISALALAVVFFVLYSVINKKQIKQNLKDKI